MISELVAALLVVAAAAAACAIVALGLESSIRLLWKIAFRAAPPFNFRLIVAYLVALLLAAYGLWVIPQFKTLFASFGADLPWSTLMLMQYHPLAALPLPLLAALHFRLRRHDRWHRYLAYFLFGEFALLLFSIAAINLPIFQFGEAVQG